MSKVLDAACAAGVVTIDGLPVAATILSEGVAPSEGVAILQGEAVTYIANTAPDLKTTIGKLADAITQLTTALAAIDAKPAGALPPAPVAAAPIIALGLIQAELTILQETLK